MAIAIRVLVVFMWPFLLAHISASEPSPAFIMNGFKDSRERLRTGKYEYRSTYTTESARSIKASTSIDMSAWFDYNSGSFRYDQVGTPPGRPDLRRNRPGFDSVGGKYVKKATQSILWQSGSDFVKIGAPNEDYSQSITTLDVRGVGLYSYYNYRKPIKFDDLFEGCLGNMQGPNVVVRRVDTHLLRVEQPVGGGSLWTDFDESRGYLPVNFAVYNGPPTKNVIISEKPSDANESATVTWTKLGGVWVPQSVIAVSGTKPQPIFRVELNFKWRMVNDPIDPVVFTTRGLDLPDGTLIGDARAGGERPVVLGAVGDMEPNPRLALLEPPTPRRWWQAWPIYAVAAVLFVAFAVGVRYWLRRRKVRV